jgi:hypothetical protein
VPDALGVGIGGHGRRSFIHFLDAALKRKTGVSGKTIESAQHIYFYPFVATGCGDQPLHSPHKMR